MSAISTPRDPHAETVGRLLRSHRFRVGLTQEQLAARSGLSPRAIRKTESGRSLPRASTLSLLAEALRLSSEDREELTTAATPKDPVADVDAAAPEVPAQLPAATPMFAGRQFELESLLHRARPGNLVIVAGMAGIGKSSVAVHAAQRLVPQFPDGQLFLDLCGYSTTRPPVDPAEALDRLLRALGVPGEKIPAHLEDRAAAFRSALSGRRVLVLLDNVADEEQLRPLLPGGSDSTVLVTSRRRLTGILDATHLGLEPWDTDTAVRVLADAVGCSAGHESLAEIVNHCGRVPLAVRIVAAKLRSRPQWTPTDLLRRMQRPSQLFPTLTTGRRSVAAAFDTTYQALPDIERRLFRLLGTLPCEQFGVHIAAALLNASPIDSDGHLEDLVDAHLLETSAPGRYHCHDLLSEYAAHTAGQADSEPERAAAFGRVLDLFTRSGTAALRHLGPHHLDELPKPGDVAPVPIPDLTGHRDAIDWYETERGNLLSMIDAATTRGLDCKAIDLAAVVWPFLLYHSHMDDLLRLTRQAVTTAGRLRDRAAEAYWLYAEGYAHHVSGDADAAASRLRQALRLYEDDGDPAGQVKVLNALGTLEDRRSDYESAIAHFERAIRLARRLGAETKEGIVRTNCADVYRVLGRPGEARNHLNAAMAIFERTGYDRELARTRFTLGTVLRGEGDAEAALELHRLVVEYAREHDEPDGLGYAHNAMGIGLLELGRIAEARAQCEWAWEAAGRARLPSLQSEIRHTQGRIHLASNTLDAAEDAFTLARSHAEAVGDSYNRAKAIHGVADVLAARGDTAADSPYAAALELYDSLGVPEAATLRHRLDHTTTRP